MRCVLWALTLCVRIVLLTLVVSVIIFCSFRCIFPFLSLALSYSLPHSFYCSLLFTLDSSLLPPLPSPSSSSSHQFGRLTRYYHRRVREESCSSAKGITFQPERTHFWLRARRMRDTFFFVSVLVPLSWPGPYLIRGIFGSRLRALCETPENNGRVRCKRKKTGYVGLSLLRNPSNTPASQK